MAEVKFDFSYFNEGKSGQISGALIQAREELWDKILERKSKADIASLEKDLNEMLKTNPMSQKNMARDDAHEILGNAFSETILERIKSYNFSEMPTRSSKDNRQSFEKSTLINSIQNAVDTIKMLVREINEMPATVDKVALIQQLRAVGKQVNKARRLLNSGEFTRFKQTNKERFTGEGAGEALDLINYLDTFVKTMNAPSSTMKELGDEFEQWLFRAGSNFANQNIQNIVGSLDTGSKLISRGAGKVSYTMSFDKEQFASIKEQFNLTTDNMTIAYDPGSYKQGKADIVFKMTDDPNMGEDYRLSAKHWSHGYGDLGHTSVDAGISRSGGISVAEAYKLAVATKVPSMDNIAQSAHDFAKLALAADIAMGLSQGNQSGFGYANLLVVKSNKGIRVFDLVNIIDDVQKGKRHLTGYDEPTIENTAINAYRAATTLRENRTQSYYALMTSVLNKMQVTLYVSAR